MNEKSNLGYLVSVNKVEFDDGSYLIEKTYVDNLDVYYGRASGVAEYVKQGQHSLPETLLVSYEVRATFSWNSSNKSVYVYGESGKVTYNQGNATISNESLNVSGNGGKIAKVKYKLTRTTNLGFSQNYGISVGCGYNGNKL